MIVELQNISKFYGAEQILNDVNLKIEDRDRIGLIGINGCGKTTLLNIIGNALPYEDGKLIKGNQSIGYLKQNPIFETKRTILEEMREVFSDLLKMEQALNELYELIAKEQDENKLKQYNRDYAKIQTIFEHRDGYHIHVKINTILNGMGFQNKDFDTLVHTLSGGEKTRLALCKLLLKEPDLLILDEPTNHLDFKTLRWLEEYLKTYKGAILMVSHDRYFLDKTVTDICEIYKGNLKRYKGNYSKFVMLKSEQLSYLTKEYDKQQVEIASLKDYVARNKARASTAKSAKSRENTLEKLDIVENPKEYLRNIKLYFDYDLEPSQEVLSISSLSLKIGNLNLCEDLNLEVKRGEKIAIVGENGVGKTTFLKSLLNQISFEGKIKWGRNTKVTYFEQESYHINENNTILSEIIHKAPHAKSENEIRTILGCLLLTNDDVYKQIKTLSGGEKAKVKFAIMMLNRANVLILDEPTNHLDLAAKEVLDKALAEFTGTILMVSHDRYLLNKVPDKIVEFHKEEFVIFEGKYDQYLDFKNQETTPEPEKTVKNIQENSYYRSKKDRSLELKKQRDLQKIEFDIEQLEEQISLLENEINLPEVVSDYVLLGEKCDLLESLRKELNLKYQDWDLNQI